MIRIDKSVTASFDVDAQKGFTPLCPNELPVPGGDEIVDELNAQAANARLRIGSKDAHNPNAVWVATKDNPQFSEVGLPNSDIRWASHCNVGTKGFELLDGLPAPIDYDFFVYKGLENDVHPYGAIFHDLAETKSTGVIEYLKQNGIKQVIIAGLATDYCVFTTVKQLKEAGFTVIVNLGGCRGIAEETVNHALNNFAGMGAAVINSAQELESV